MTLASVILKKSHESLCQYPSPPPELEEKKAKKSVVNKFSHVQPRIDNAAPLLHNRTQVRNLNANLDRGKKIYINNIQLLLFIRNVQINGGKVDSRWKYVPKECMYYYCKRKLHIDRINKENPRIYEIIKTAKKCGRRLYVLSDEIYFLCEVKFLPKVETTRSLLLDWLKNRQEIISKATMPFVLFPPTKVDVCEDLAFKPHDNVKRPRIHIELKMHEGCVLGVLRVELFTDVCPETCTLFMDLLAGDGVGYSYVGTTFFRKVPGLYWSGGDVTYNNGFGCYAQKGRSCPIGAENYHFSHSMPGLLSMRVTRDNEMCGIFNITFKPLPQFDLHSVVFGRIIRPSQTLTTMSELGTVLGSRPQILISKTKYHQAGKWRYGMQNTKIIHPHKRFIKDGK